MAERYHITKRGDGWALKKEGNLKATKVYSSREEATKSAQKYRTMGSDVIIHNIDGSIDKWQKKK